MRADRPATTATPLGALETTIVDGCRFLSEPDLTYHDGGEPRVLEILRGATDLSSSSDELVAQAASWPEIYHLTPARANVIRPLELSAQDTVLEIGAGCGAITRYLGEQCGAVDAIEPMADRARCARERTRDLENVEIYVGLLDDVPLAEAYDVVVIMGVLEYVGHGSPDASIYAGFLERAASLLRPGGTLVLGIENRLGVKYLVGAPEDHSGRAFETLEGYDEASVARTFSRRELEGLLLGCGLEVTTLGLFPDYKLARTIFHDDLFEIAPHLVTSIPSFPSPDWGDNGTRVASEARAWRTLVDAGLGTQTANSLLVLGQRGPLRPVRWPDSMLAAFYSPASRRAVYSLETRIARSGGDLEVSRRRLKDGPVPEGLVVSSGPVTMTEGIGLLDLMLATTTDEELRGVLLAWRDALDEEIDRHPLDSLDLLPHNAVRTEDGSLVFVDSKWAFPGFDRDAILGRAVVNLATWFAVNTSPERWEAETVGELAIHLGALLDLPEPSGWLPEVLAREARLQATVSIPSSEDADLDAHLRRISAESEAFFDTSLRALRGVTPSVLVQAAERLRGQLADSESAIQVLGQQRDALDQQRAALDQEIRAIYATRLFRFSSTPRAIYRRLRGW